MPLNLNVKNSEYDGRTSRDSLLQIQSEASFQQAREASPFLGHYMQPSASQAQQPLKDKKVVRKSPAKKQPAPKSRYMKPGSPGPQNYESLVLEADQKIIFLEKLLKAEEDKNMWQTELLKI